MIKSKTSIIKELKDKYEMGLISQLEYIMALGTTNYYYRIKNRLEQQLIESEQTYSGSMKKLCDIEVKDWDKLLKEEDL